MDLPLKDYGTVKAIIFEDPDGIIIELMQLPTAEEVQAYANTGLKTLNVDSQWRT